MEGQTSLRRRASSESEAETQARKRARSATASASDPSRASSPVVPRPRAPAGARRGGMGAAAAAEQRQGQGGAGGGTIGTGGLSAKAVSDKFAQLSAKIGDLEDAVKAQNASAVEMKNAISIAQNDIKLLDEYSQKQSKHIKVLRAEVTELTDRVQACEARLADVLEQHTAANARSGERVSAGAGPGQEGSGGKVRNNALQGGVRACVHSVMGVEPGASLPEPIGGGVYWMEMLTRIGPGENDVVREEVLRPDWTRSWDENKHNWLHRVVLLIQARGWDDQKTLSREQIAQLSQVEIGEAVKTAFDWMVRKYELEHKDDEGKAKKEAAYKSKIAGRKTKKAARRTKVRDKVPAARAPEFDHQFLPAYQSTDESGYEDIEIAATRVADDSSDRDEQPAGGGAANATRRTRRQKVLIARPGAWRLQTTTDTLVELDDTPEDIEDGEEPGIPRYQRRRGEPRSWQESALPTLRRVKHKIFIPRCMVNTEWLESEDGKKFDSPKYIASSAMVEQEGEAGEGEGEGEGDGEEQE